MGSLYPANSDELTSIVIVHALDQAYFLWVTIHALGQAYTFLQLAKDCIRKIMSCGDMHVQKAHIEEEDVSFLHEAGMKVKRFFP